MSLLRPAAARILDVPRQIQQRAPVFETFLFRFEQRFARIAVFVEVFGKATFLKLLCPSLDATLRSPC